MSLHRLQRKVPPLTPGRPWPEWKAERLNEFFEKHGVTKEKANILPSTVTHGER